MTNISKLNFQQFCFQWCDRVLNPNHPAMQKKIAKLIQTAHAHQIDCCICGQAPVEHPDLINKLIKWGVDTISVEPEAVNRTNIK